jgi:hypothetical protein
LLLEKGLVLYDEGENAIQFVPAEAVVCCQSYGAQPELRVILIPFYMDVRRLLAFVAEEEELVGADSQDGWHLPSF